MNLKQEKFKNKFDILLLRKILGFLGKTLILLSHGKSEYIREKEFEKIPEIKKTKLYVSTEIGLRLRSSPNTENDENILEKLPYGSELFLIQKTDKWLNVKNGQNKGWVSAFYVSEINPIKEVLPAVKEKVIIEKPIFKKCVSNLAEDKNTKIVRKLINDEMGGGINKWELQCTEYVQYKIQEMGIRINWPIKSGRHGGKWGKIFKTYGLYKILDYPKAGCSISFTSGFKSKEASNYGHVAFIEKVFEDDSIKISEANWPNNGKYNERILSVYEWKDKYRGVFVNFDC